MNLKAPMFLAAICMAGTMPGADAQPYYPAYLYAQPVPAPQPPPPAWSYDPYTSGAAPCPQGIRGDLLTCQQKMPPTYGQPSYWPQR
jgi:hypothetical protein